MPIFSTAQDAQHTLQTAVDAGANEIAFDGITSPINWSTEPHGVPVGMAHIPLPDTDGKTIDTFSLLAYKTT